MNMNNRRTFLTGAGAAAMLLAAPRVLFARAATERRFVFVIQRGAADGLHTVVPYADPAYASLRRELAIDPPSAIRLDGTFALHPSLVEFGRLYASGQALCVHAVASPYRDRSHFDGQNVLESGGSAPYQLRDGWMNRLVALLPRAGKEPIAFAPTVPLALRGAAEVTSYAPSALAQPSDDLLQRVQQLYANDEQLHALWSAALDARAMAAMNGDVRNQQNPAAIGRLAAGFLAQADGPRLAMIETNGWDTHSAQNGRLANQLKGLDAMIAALHEGLGDAWADTVIVVATEFGRTAAANGTGGTDHGTASAALVAGGAVQGGRVLADWPGLGPGALYEGRDLRPTQDLDALLAGLAAQTFSLDPVRVGRTLFPQMKPGRPLPTLVQA
jgi:uncharacterized protein (DUF1501 family)